MFAAIHFPIADARLNWGKLVEPLWPFPMRGFLRGFGAVRSRRRGGPSDFLGEHVFADASNALRFDENASVESSPLICRHRRLFHDGRFYTRVDVGFRSVREGSFNPRSVCRTVLDTPVHVRISGKQGHKKALSEIGSDLAQSYYYASSRRDATNASHLVLASAPIVVVESDDPCEPPTFAFRARAKEGRRRVAVSSWLEDTPGGPVRCWMLTGAPSLRREVRMSLVGSYVELMCVNSVLALARRGALGSLGLSSDQINKTIAVSVERSRRLFGNAEAGLAATGTDFVSVVFPPNAQALAHAILTEGERFLETVALGQE